MILPDYFDPVDFSHYKSSENPLGNYSLGPAIQKASEKISFNHSTKPDIAILGVPVVHGIYHTKGISDPDKIRVSLYQLAAIGSNLKIVDLGNLKLSTNQKGYYLALRDIVEYLKEMEVVTVVLGGSQDLTVGICEAFKNSPFFWLSVVDSVLDVKKGIETSGSTNYLTRIFKNNPKLFQFSLIGYQLHLIGEKLLNKTTQFGDHLRLGQLRDNFSQVELLLRNTDVLSFDMGSLKYSEIFPANNKYPNGLRGEEACKIGHYAGLSQRLKIFGLFEVNNNNSEKNNISVGLAAEIIWYFLEGQSQKITAGKRTIYKVAIEGLETPIIFRHDQENDRWWYEVHSVSGEAYEIACSAEEYQQAAENEIPERWLKFVQKMDSI